MTSHLRQHYQRTLPNNNLRNHIPEVNPYAAPVPLVSPQLSDHSDHQQQHDYEDIGTAMIDINSFGLTLPLNIAHNNHNQTANRQNGRTPRLNAHSSLRRPPSNNNQQQHHVTDNEAALYYEAAVAAQAAACRDGQVAYGTHNNRNSVPNYCFHNTRSPIYYSEGTTRR
jgi:hypothetical protein